MCLFIFILNILVGTGTISFDNLSFVTLSDGQIFDWLSVGVLCCLDNAGLKELDINLALAGAQSDGWIARPVYINDPNPLIGININNLNTNINTGLFSAFTNSTPHTLSLLLYADHKKMRLYRKIICSNLVANFTC